MQENNDDRQSQFLEAMLVCKRKASLKIMLGTSDDWSMSHLSKRTSKPANYIVDCRILKHPLMVALFCGTILISLGKTGNKIGTYWTQVPAVKLTPYLRPTSHL